MKIEEINALIQDIDNEDSILDYKLSNGICFWLILRYDIFSMLLKKLVNPSSDAIKQTIGLNTKIKNKLSQLKYRRIIKSRNPLHINEHFDCLNICSSTATIAGNSGFKSRISGVLIDTKELNTLQLIVSNNRQYHSRYEGRYCFFDALLQGKSAFSKEALNDQQLQQNNDFIMLLQKHLHPYLIAPHWKNIADRLEVYANKVNYFEKTFTQLLDQTSPKIIFIEDGNYGNLEYCTLIKIAKEKKIATAEFQHGVFDIAFQYSKKIIKNPAFAYHKTDYVLTYGGYFSKFIQSSSVNVETGSYFIEQKKDQIVYAWSETKVILFITQGAYTDKIIPVLHKALSSLNNPFKLIIRLHPSDNKNRGKYKLFDQFSNTSYSVHEDVYSQMANADHVVGSFSTLLFEAIYFNKNPLIYKNNLSDYYIPQQIGKRFQHAGELQKIFENPLDEKVETQHTEFYWSLNSQERFEKFVKKIKSTS